MVEQLIAEGLPRHEAATAAAINLGYLPPSGDVIDRSTLTEKQRRYLGLDEKVQEIARENLPDDLRKLVEQYVMEGVSVESALECAGMVLGYIPPTGDVVR